MPTAFAFAIAPRRETSARKPPVPTVASEQRP